MKSFEIDCFVHMEIFDSLGCIDKNISKRSSERFSERLHNLIRKEDSVAIQVIDLFKLSINKVSIEARLFDGEEEKRFRGRGF